MQTFFNTSNCHLANGRMGAWKFSFPDQYSVGLGERCASTMGLPARVDGVALETLLLGTLAPARDAAARGEPVEFDFLKLDADGPENEWLTKIESMITTDKLRVRTIQVEGSHLSRTLLHRLQSLHGYEFYRLDSVDGRRKMSPGGWDVFSPRGTIACQGAPGGIRRPQQGATQESTDWPFLS